MGMVEIECNTLYKSIVIVAPVHLAGHPADMDARALALSNYRRDLAVGAGMKWALHRRQHYLRRRVVGWLDGVSPQLTARLRARHSAAVSSRPAAPGRASLH